MSASERRAAGEAAFCDCSACVFAARYDMHAVWPRSMGALESESIAALLRALVIQALLDPATWAHPEGWRP